MPELLENTQDKLVSHADYAAMDFKPMINKEEAARFGGEILHNESAGIRIAAIVLSKSKDELLGDFGKDAETLMQTIEYLQGQEEFLNVLMKNNSQAIARLLCVASNVISEDEE